MADMKKDDGLQKVIDFLDGELGKDEMEASFANFEDFDDYRKSPHESFNAYISNFDQKVSKMKKTGCTLPSHVLAFTLLRRAGLSMEEKMLVLSGVNYENKDTLYEQTIKSMKKFKGEGSSCGANISSMNSPSQPVIKVEPAYYTRGGYGYRGNNSRYPQSSGRGIFRGNARGHLPFRQNTGGLFRSYGRNEGPNNAGSWRGRGGNGNPWKSQVATSGEKATNPIGTDGRPLRCSSCDSFRHFLKDCPHSWENSGMKKMPVHYTQDNFSSMPAVNYTHESSNYEDNQY
jgi:hypothetical protein